MAQILAQGLAFVLMSSITRSMLHSRTHTVVEQLNSYFALLIYTKQMSTVFAVVEQGTKFGLGST
jgi:hypothetical protein